MPSKRGVSVIITTILLIGIAVSTAFVLYNSIPPFGLPEDSSGKIMERLDIVKVNVVASSDQAFITLFILNSGAVNTTVNSLYVETVFRTLIAVPPVNWDSYGPMSPGEIINVSFSIPKEYLGTPVLFSIVTKSGYKTWSTYLLPTAEEAGGSQGPIEGIITTYSISGIVFNDRDRDGLYIPASDEPIPGVLVSIKLPTGYEIFAFTDPQGRYSVGGLNKNYYEVTSAFPPATSDGVWSNSTPYVRNIMIKSSSQDNVNFGFYWIGSAARYRVSGIVFNDSNFDGVRDPAAGELGLSDWLVSVRSIGGPMYATRTASDGSYFFDLFPGAYVVSVILKPGWTNTTTWSLPVVVENSTISGLDFGVNFTGFPPHTQLSISGRVFNDTDMNGVFIPPGDLPLEGWEVVYGRIGGPFYLAEPTNTNGIYTVVDIEPGTYLLELMMREGWTNTTSFLRAVSVSSSPVSGIDFGIFYSGGGSLVQLSISGRVFNDTDSNGVFDQFVDRPLIGWRVNLLDSNNLPIYTYVTGAEGLFSFSGLAPGTYNLTVVSQSGWINTTRMWYSVVISDASLWKDFGFHSAGAPVTFTVYGTIFEDSDSNGFYDPLTDDPLEGWSVLLYEGIYSGTGFPVRYAVTGADGFYSFGSLISGSNYTVIAVMDLGYTNSTPRVQYVFNSSVSINFGFVSTAVPWNYSISGLVFNDTDANGVKNAYDPPMADWQVLVSQSSTGIPVQVAISDNDGTFRAYGLGPGSYLVSLLLKERWVNTSMPVPVTITLSSVSGIELGASYIPLSPTYVISGIVFNDTNNNGALEAGEPGLPGWSVWLYNGTYNSTATPWQKSTTLATGEFFFSGIPDGTYTVLGLLSPGWTNTTVRYVTATVAGGHISSLRFGVSPIATAQYYSVGGYVYNDTDRNGEMNFYDPGLVNWELFLLDFDGFPIGYNTSRTGGIYQFAPLPEGVYTVFVRILQGYSNSTPSIRSVTIAGGPVLDLNFGVYQINASPVQPRFNLSGRILRSPQNTAISGFSVWLFVGDRSGGLTIDDFPIARTTTNSTGHYLFTNLPPGTYTAIAVVPYNWQPVGPRYRIGTIVNASITVPDMLMQSRSSNRYTVSGYVYNDTDQNGIYDPVGDKGLYGWEVFILDNMAFPVGTGRATTSSTGYYQFTNIWPGDYTVYIRMQSGYQNSTPRAQNITVNSASVSNVNFLVYRTASPPTYYVRASVIQDINGNSRYDAGEGLSGWWVWVYSGVYTGGVAYPIRVATTDSTGNVTFSNLPAGTYTVVQLPMANWTNVTPRRVVVTLTENTNVLFIVRTVTGQPTYYLSGMVFRDFDRDGDYTSPPDSPLAWTVYINDASGLPFAAYNTSSANGIFNFSGLIAGNYMVYVANQTGYVNSTPASVTINLASNTEGLLFGIYQLSQTPTMAISGRVFNDTNRNGLYEPGTEPPLGGWRVLLYIGNYSITAIPSYTAITNASGWFQFTGLSFRDYTLVLSMEPGYTNSTPRVYYMINDSAQVLMGVYPIPPQQLYSISGYVFNDTDRNGAFAQGIEPGLANWTVYLNDISGLPLYVTRTNGSGFYSFLGLTPGTYTVYLNNSISGWANSTPRRVSLEITSDSRSLDFGFFMTSAQRVYSISGFIFNDQDRSGSYNEGDSPLEGWTVMLYDSVGNLLNTSTTGNDGAFAFANLNNGSYTIIEVIPINWVNSTPRVIPINISGASVSGISIGNYYNVSSPVTFTISGIVFNDTNRNGLYDTGSENPLQGWSVIYRPPEGGIVQAVTDSGGRYVFYTMPPGNYTLELITKEGWVNTTSSRIAVVVTDRDSTNNNFGVRYNRFNVTGFVFFDPNQNGFDSADYYLANWTVILSGSAGSFTTSTDPSGAFSFLNVPGGNYALSATVPQGWTNTTASSVMIDLQSSVSGQSFGFRRSFFAGLYITYTRQQWSSEPTLTAGNFSAAYPSGFVEIGRPGTAENYSIIWTNVTTMRTYLPNSYPSTQLTQDYINPGTYPAGQFGANVLALELNVRFSERSISIFPTGFGNLRLYNYHPSVNGKSVAEILSVANQVLGGASVSSLLPGFTIDGLNNLLAQLNSAFMYGSSDISWANQYLF
ncbi:MAG: SdrD B-like domain-containing protein [Candidatus Verstraetearchaeota archaeon]|nr:SdrD B-like domain-containing protein [Candidatus Verstraetearchaeota archaeon]